MVVAEEKPVVFNLRMQHALFEKLKRKAANERRTMTAIVLIELEKALSKEKAR